MERQGLAFVPQVSESMPFTATKRVVARAGSAKPTRIPTRTSGTRRTTRMTASRRRVSGKAFLLRGPGFVPEAPSMAFARFVDARRASRRTDDRPPGARIRARTDVHAPPRGLQGKPDLAR